jgi:hypothetical protein
VVAFAVRRVKKRASIAVITGLIFVSTLSLWLGLGHPTPAEGQGFTRQSPPARARVVIVEDPGSVFAFSPAPEHADEMVSKGLTVLTGKSSAGEAWRSLVSTQDTVGIKVFSAPGGTSGTRPAVVGAIIKGLLSAGLPARKIIIWDKQLSDLRAAGFMALAEQLGVGVAGSADEGYDEKAAPYESALLGKLVWGDFEFGKKGENVGRRSFVSKLLTQRLTKVINVTPLLNHNLAQVTGSLYSLALGSVDNTIRFEVPENNLGQAIPEIYALADVGDRVVLNVVDALICQYQGEERTLLHYSTMLGQLRFSTDPVALDVLSVHELDHQRQLARVPPVKPSWQIFTNAALLDLGVSDLRSMDVIKVDAIPKE